MNSLKKNVLMYLQNNPNKHYSKTSLRQQLGIGTSHRRVFSDAIKELEKEGILVSSKKSRVSIKRGLSLIVGRFYSNSRGYGFVVNSEKKKAVFIAKDFVGEAMHEDLVVAVIMGHPVGSRNAEGKIISILKREIDTIVGTYMDSETFGFVMPDDLHFQYDIYIPKDMSLNAKSYDKVVCKIKKYPKKNRKPEGEIVEVIGVKFDKGIDLLSILKDKKIPQEFSAKVIRESDAISEIISIKDRENRLDLRNEIVFTIDGEDAKDLDDAISIAKNEDGNFLLGVHIADISHYVKENSKIDNEALERGTSVYLIDTVIPMLPKKLSNHLCSLQANEDKLALSVFMEVSPQGNVVDRSFHESIIHSRARLTYKEVSDHLEGNTQEFSEKYPFLVERIKWMKDLSDILKMKRKKRGAIEFDFSETKILLAPNGDVEDVQKYERRIAHGLIEECMLLCNETVAEFFMKKAIPFVYRVHEKPREERMQDFQAFIEQYGYIISDMKNLTTKELQELLAKVKDAPEGQAINFLLLRSMMQARYSPLCKGHFGLAADYYSHFTSPIRRYPDLQIHRIMKEYLNGMITMERKNELEKIVEKSAMMASKRERIAERAEEEYKLLKKIEFMKSKVGETYIATIVNMNNSSLTVAMENTVEGRVYMHSLKSPYYFEEKTFEWIEEGEEQRLRLGDTIVVRVKGVSIERKEIEFDFVSF
ncbi:ribonuclease R [Brevibacillus sp. NPDC058079]|uniref:ribonuclease R n=1 Tax=Brevibacillus sp. NPDC058079 TaxID=3346330 RepID=UPI0036E3BB8D